MEDWGEEIFAEGVGVKWKNERGGREGKILVPHLPLHQPWLSFESGWVGWVRSTWTDSGYLERLYMLMSDLIPQKKRIVNCH